MSRPEFVEIEHDDIATTGKVARDSLPIWMALGWRLVQPDPEPEPEPLFVFDAVTNKIIPIESSTQNAEPEWTPQGASEQEADVAADESQES